MQNSISYQPPRWILGFVAWSATAVIAFFAILNVQPWLSAARFLAGTTPDIPIISSLYDLPFGVGAAIAYLAANILTLGGVFIWAVVQGIQIAPMWVNRPSSLRSLRRRAEIYLEEQGVPKNKQKEATDRLAARLDSALTSEIDAVENLRVWAYCLELIVCVFHFPVYADGHAALWSDIWARNVNMEALQPREIAMVVIMMGGFELLFTIALTIWGLYSARGVSHE